MYSSCKCIYKLNVISLDLITLSVDQSLESSIIFTLIYYIHNDIVWLVYAMPHNDMSNKILSYHHIFISTTPPPPIVLNQGFRAGQYSVKRSDVTR